MRTIRAVSSSPLYPSRHPPQSVAACLSREPAILRREGANHARRPRRIGPRGEARKEPTSSSARRGPSPCSSDRSHEADTFAPDLGARLVGLGPFAQVVERQAGHGGEIHRAGPGYAIVVTRVSCVRQAETGRLLATGLCVLIEFDALENVNPSFKDDANVVAMPPR